MYGVLMLTLAKFITKKALSLSISNQTNSFKGLSLNIKQTLLLFMLSCHKQLFAAYNEPIMFRLILVLSVFFVYSLELASCILTSYHRIH